MSRWLEGDTFYIDITKLEMERVYTFARIAVSLGPEFRAGECFAAGVVVRNADARQL